MKNVISGTIALSTAAMTLASDPFADVEPAAAARALSPRSWKDDLLFRREIYWMTTAGREDFAETHDLYSRVSAGFEVQKRFSTATRTLAALDYQGRVVYRHHILDTAGDPMGMDASTWEYETHNAYADLYNPLGEPGRFNLRAGRFYLPFGLNYQTDTHGTLLQLSNDRVFGTERDWQVTAYGEATRHLDYAAGYVLGSGPEQEVDGQKGMAMGRLGLGSPVLFERGLEGGVSAAYGERIDPHVAPTVAIETWRAGADLRKRFDSALGPFTLTGEAAVGEDDTEGVWSGLAQAEWLNPGRRWGMAAQYSRLMRETDGEESRDDADERTHLVLTRYFRNEIGNAALHWIALGVERQMQIPEDGPDTLFTVQYYRYW